MEQPKRALTQVALSTQLWQGLARRPPGRAGIGGAAVVIGCCWWAASRRRRSCQYRKCTFQTVGCFACHFTTYSNLLAVQAAFPLRHPESQNASLLGGDPWVRWCTSSGPGVVRLECGVVFGAHMSWPESCGTDRPGECRSRWLCTRLPCTASDPSIPARPMRLKTQPPPAGHDESSAARATSERPHLKVVHTESQQRGRASWAASVRGIRLPTQADWDAGRRKR